MSDFQLWRKIWPAVWSVNLSTTVSFAPGHVILVDEEERAVDGDHDKDDGHGHIADVDDRVGFGADQRRCQRKRLGHRGHDRADTRAHDDDGADLLVRQVHGNQNTDGQHTDDRGSRDRVAQQRAGNGERKQNAHNQDTRMPAEFGGHRADDGVDRAEAHGDFCEQAARDRQRNNPRQTVQSIKPGGNPGLGAVNAREQQGERTGDDQRRIDLSADERNLLAQHEDEQDGHGDSDFEHA